jgi:hypothetical protein
MGLVASVALEDVAVVVAAAAVQLSHFVGGVFEPFLDAGGPLEAASC